MEFDISRWIGVLAIFLLVPGLVFLTIVVIYVAFVPKKGPRPLNGEPAAIPEPQDSADGEVRA